MAKIILFNKPYGVISQFSGSDSFQTLANYLKEPALKGCYPAGRLDKDSEGLLLLTDDGALQHRISHPEHKLPKTYLVQVEGDIGEDELVRLRTGVALKDGMTKTAKAKRIPAPSLWERSVPVRTRKHIPSQWIELILYEGKNRQVRRMTAEVGYPTLRLIRISIGDWHLNTLLPGQFQLDEVHLPTQSRPIKTNSTRKRNLPRGKR